FSTLSTQFTAALLSGGLKNLVNLLTIFGFRIQETCQLPSFDFGYTIGKSTNIEFISNAGLTWWSL
ncbi:MAG: hypothetical protein NDF58_08920, partial [archaeon YNP-LCB-024-027]|nr:hypothetical protein [Candidatus Culexarchaeum yellowstonense]